MARFSSACYPPSIELPDDVHLARLKRNVQVVRSAKLGVLVRSLIIAFELVGVFLFASSSLFMDAIASLMDVVASLFLIFCMKLAQRPPDADHPFGHGRYEPLGGLLLGLLLTVTGSVMAVQQTFESMQQTVYHPIHPLAWTFPLIAMVLLELCYQFIMRTATSENSPALAVDAVHYRIDGLTSLCATLALLMAGYWPSWGLFIDHAGALAIAVFMIGVGLYACRDNLHQLMDKMPDSLFFDKVRRAASQVNGVKGTEKIRIQSYGPDAHVDIDIEVDPRLSVDLAHKISQRVRVEIQKAWPAVRDVTVHVEPYYANDH